MLPKIDESFLYKSSISDNNPLSNNFPNKPFILPDKTKTPSIFVYKSSILQWGSVGKLFPLSKNIYKYYFEGFEEKKYTVKITVK